MIKRTVKAVYDELRWLFADRFPSCRRSGHDWRPDRIYLFGVCRRCGVPSDKPQPGQEGEETYHCSICFDTGYEDCPDLTCEDAEHWWYCRCGFGLFRATGDTSQLPRAADTGEAQ